MTSIARRLLSTSSITRSTSAAFEPTLPLDPTSPVHFKHLPRVLQRRIAKRISSLEISSEDGSLPSKINIPNPFLVQRMNRRSAESDLTGEARYNWKKPAISNRRQKQLLQFYPSIDLPLSTKSPRPSSSSGSESAELSEIVGVSRPVKFNEKITINWTGQLPYKAQEKEVDEGVKSLYTGRKVMFKGHKDERNRTQKLADRQARLDGMEKRIRDWRQGRNDEKIRNRPSLPF
ncbi:hypothetical protein I302_101456 [Kwoniella bestiolae CBS 10118]|uniref:Large ribosomal subunit protein mL59 domain-containing protein n=1 Tax=Kwoniella bestiolae CBS 10118 TaxID=1296100 RepID=A0A1B9GCA7_9TREE|nr:hypothetical protein I302_00139 [Kwoniella bestiolae CBS 10118]OCF28650.1 hypothetical protein I302_00139 [Kwoniella bestiolae CBS 10118]